MKLAISFVVFSITCFSASATPVTITPSPGSIQIPLVKRAPLSTSAGVDATALRHHIQQVTRKFDRGFVAYHNNTGKPHPLAGGKVSRNSNHLSHRDISPVGLTNQGNKMWHGAIAVGTPPQRFSVDFDTGSSDLILPGISCTVNCQGHRAYDSQKSATSQNLFTPFQSMFGDKSQVYGMQYTDTVSIGNMTAPKQTLGTAQRYAASFSSSQFTADGLLGMGFRSISEYHAEPVFQTLLAHNQAPEPVFAFKLASGVGDSELTLGGTNPSLFKGEVAWTPVTEEAYWQVKMNGLKLGDETMVRDHPAIIDTGTTLLMGDVGSVAKFYSSVRGAKLAPEIGPHFYSFPCDSTPEVSLQFGGKDFKIPREVFSLGPKGPGSNECVGGLVGGEGLRFWVVGDVFLRSVYTVFDVGQKRVGFAELA